MLVDEAELAARRAAWVKPADRFERGYGWMYAGHVTQADQGCDFDFLDRGLERRRASRIFFEGPSAGGLSA